MKFVEKVDITPCFEYDNNVYVPSNRKNFFIGDLFFDERDSCFKVIESEKDLQKVSCLAPEYYMILERA